MLSDLWTTERYQLHFSILRSMRYHDRRRAFFAYVRKVTNALTMLLSGSVIFSVAHEGSHDPMWLTWLALFAALLTVCDLVVGYSASESLHDSLRRRFADLLLSIQTAPDDQTDCSKWNVTRIQIEVDEPPVYRALDVLCHNELLHAQGFSGDELKAETKIVKWYERVTCHLFKWSDIGDAQVKRLQQAT